MSVRSSRRKFLKKSLAIGGAAAAAGLFPAPLVLAARETPDKLRVAVIGAGGMMGGYSMENAAKEHLVAVCDTSDKQLAKGIREKARDANPKTYFDYRTMLDEVEKDIDVVLIATPDHNHAPAAIRAINRGKHVFCQKPLAYNISECHALANAAKEKKVLTQMGNQGHCGDAIRLVCEYIWAGALGNVTEVHAILGRNFGGTGGRLPTKPVPEGLHWNEWIGPAQYRDYHDKLDPFEWRSWREFGTGTIGDMACHNMDALFWALKLKDAKSYTIECISQKGGSEEKFPTDNVVRYDVPARGDMKPVKVFTYDHGGIRPQIMADVEKKYGRRLPEELFVGDNGLYIGNDARLIPESKIKEVPKPPRVLPRAHGGPIEDLFWAIKNDGVACSNYLDPPGGSAKPTPCSNFPDAAAPLSSFALSAHLAMYAGVGKKVEFDAEKMEVTNLPELNKYIRRAEYRKGWEI